MQHMTRLVHPANIILENVRSARNVGHILRTAALLGGNTVGLAGLSAKPTQRNVLRGSLGGDQLVSSFNSNTTSGAVALMKCSFPKMIIISVETTQTSVDSLKFFQQNATKLSDSGFVLIFGNEVSGVDDRTLAMSHHHIHIPLYGLKSSLNVSDCASVILSQMSTTVSPSHNITVPNGVSFPSLTEYPSELSSRPGNKHADAFTSWANVRLNATIHPIPYG